MRYPQLAIGVFMAMIVVLIPLPRLWRARNIACVALVFWFFQHNLISFVNLIIWAGNVNNSAPVWCDITNKLQAGAGIALPAATLCLARYLELISRSQPVNQWYRARFELAMCIGLPVIWMFLAFCFQASRTTIIEDFGCVMQIYPSLLPRLLLRVPPLLMSIATLIFGSIALFHFLKSRRTRLVRDDTSTGALSSIQYLRLMLICVIIGIWGSVWLALQLASDLLGLGPLPSWNVIHSEISTVVEFPTIFFTPEDVNSILLFSWAIPGASYFFFLLFGTSRDVLSEYIKFWMWLRTKVLKHTAKKKPVLGTKSTQSSTQWTSHSSMFDDDTEAKPSHSPVSAR